MTGEDYKISQRVSAILNRLSEIEAELANGEDKPSLIREYKRLKAIEPTAKKFLMASKEIADAEAMLETETDEEMREYLASETRRLEGELLDLRSRLMQFLLPRSPQDDSNALVEIRAGTGGEEAALFAGDLFKMYSRFAEQEGFRVSVAESHPTPLGGFKEIIFIVEGDGAYRLLKYESGVHRVQRIPRTESGGRIHTSSASVVVMPEQEEEEGVEIKPQDLEIDTMRAGGPGGQHQNMTDSAVRITHKPTGIVVVCRDERSQHKNKERAMRILRARLAERERERRERETGNVRRTAIGTGDRSEKIRTYNFPQNRLTDHRIGLTLYQLERIMDGELRPVVDALLEAEAERLLAEI
ncbi:MAG: peptide chain release factor 1 [candidate division WOR-3 bacterium]